MVRAKLLIYDVITVAYVLLVIMALAPWALLSMAPDNHLFLDVSNAIYHFFSYLCNQLSYRSLYLDGIKMPICARCISIYTATILGLVFFRLKGFGAKEFKINYLLAVLLFLPTGLDGTTQLFGWRESTNLLRLITGFPYGIGYAYLIVWTLPFVFLLLEMLQTLVTGGKMEKVEAIALRIKKMVWPLF